MKFVTNIDKEKFNKFVEKHSKGHFLQTSEWGDFKGRYKWTVHRVGMEKDGELIATALLLVRKLPVVNKTIIYSPRGFVIDFNDLKLVEKFTEFIQDYCKKLNAVFVKIDPDILCKERDIDGNIVKNGEDNSHIIEILKILGYTHKGFSLDFNGIQPRFVFRLDITPSEEDIFKNFSSKTRYNIRLAERKGIEIVEGTREDLKKITEIMKITGERDNFITRPLFYFEKMYDEFVHTGHLKLFLAKYNLNKGIAVVGQKIKDLDKELKVLICKDNLENRDAVLSEKIAIKEKLKNEHLQLLKEREKHPDGIIISGAIVSKFGDKAWYMYGASDNIYRDLMPNYLLQWYMIKWAKQSGCKIYDFRGISGDLNKSNPLYGLYRFKKGFNGDFTEFIGEFDLILDKFFYYLWEVLLPKFKKARKILFKRK